MVNPVLTGVLAVGIGSGQTMLLRCLTNWFLGSKAVRTLLVATAVLRLILVSMIGAILLWWGPDPAMWALVGCWIGRTMAFALR
jgi:hypothetical protein